MGQVAATVFGVLNVLLADVLKCYFLLFIFRRQFIQLPILPNIVCDVPTYVVVVVRSNYCCVVYFILKVIALHFSWSSFFSRFVFCVVPTLRRRQQPAASKASKNTKETNENNNKDRERTCERGFTAARKVLHYTLHTYILYFSAYFFLSFSFGFVVGCYWIISFHFFFLFFFIFVVYARRVSVR